MGTILLPQAFCMVSKELNSDFHVWQILYQLSNFFILLTQILNAMLSKMYETSLLHEIL